MYRTNEDRNQKFSTTLNLNILIPDGDDFEMALKKVAEMIEGAILTSVKDGDLLKNVRVNLTFPQLLSYGGAISKENITDFMWPVGQDIKCDNETDEEYEMTKDERIDKVLRSFNFDYIRGFKSTKED